MSMQRTFGSLLIFLNVALAAGLVWPQIMNYVVVGVLFAVMVAMCALGFLLMFEEN